jgi:N-glycosylase/DNA lyase
MIARQYRYLDTLRAAYAQKRDPILRRLTEFKEVPPQEYFYELIYCLLTPQSSAVNAGKAVTALRASGYPGASVDIADILRDPHHYIRFHRTKARHIREATERYPEIYTHLSNGATGTELREWLVKNVKGLGWKEASHVLRNIGHGNLAILDRHILKRLQHHNVISSIPETLTRARYLTIEQKIAAFASETGIAMDVLDLLFWSTETGEILK